MVLYSTTPQMAGVAKVWCVTRLVRGSEVTEEFGSFEDAKHRFLQLAANQIQLNATKAGRRG